MLSGEEPRAAASAALTSLRLPGSQPWISPWDRSLQPFLSLPPSAAARPFPSLPIANCQPAGSAQLDAAGWAGGANPRPVELRIPARPGWPRDVVGSSRVRVGGSASQVLLPGLQGTWLPSAFTEAKGRALLSTVLA